MPSSRDAAAAVMWQPDELSDGAVATGHLSAVPSARDFQPVEHDTLTPTLPPVARLFDATHAVGVPDAVLAPAREAAAQRGYIAGWNQGHQAAVESAGARERQHRAQLDVRAQAALDDLDRAAAAMRAAAAAVLAQQVQVGEQTEALVVDSAFAIAEALVGIVLADDATRGRAAVLRAMAAAPGDGRMSIRLNPADLAALPTDLALPEHVGVVGDPSVAAGDAFAVCGSTTIDARIGAGLERVRTLLGRTGR